MATVDDTIADLERQRLQLEENVRKLQQSLYHWRLWEAEYDGLKEEIASLKDDSTKDDILEKGREFAGTVVDEKEVKDLIGEGQGFTRSRDQVVQRISRRLDYVKQNVRTMEKQLEAAESKLDSLLSIEHPGPITKDAEFPVTEIVEELDEEGNVISGKTTKPGEHASELIDVLKKVGIEDIPDKISKTRAEANKSEEKAPEEKTEEKTLEKEALEEKVSEEKVSEKALEEKSPNEVSPDEKAPEEKVADEKAASGKTAETKAAEGEVTEEKVPKVRVSEEKTPEEKVSDEETPEQQASEGKIPEGKTPDEELKQPPREGVTETESFDKPQPTVNGERLATTTAPAPTVIEEPNDEIEQPVSDVDEPIEDAKLRREMLEYGFREVGAVVAELEMDEEGSEFSVEDDFEYDDEEEDEEEDEYGRSTQPVLTEEIHQQMRELEKKLNARGMLNIGKDTSVLPEEVRRELEEPRATKVEEAKAEKAAEESKPEEKKKKKVSFAPELDIAPDPKPPAPEKTERITRREQPAVAPIAESIVERTVKGDNPAEETPAASKKVSRFKMARSIGSQAAEATSLGSTIQPAAAKKQPTAPQSPSSLPLFPAKPKEPKPFSQPIVDRDVEDATRPSAPRPPEGKTVADKLAEREVPDGSNVTAPEPDELDEEIHRKEIASEFYRMRNRMIQRKGGFVNDEQEVVPLDEPSADGQPPKRVSRFKAARMR